MPPATPHPTVLRTELHGLRAAPRPAARSALVAAAVATVALCVARRTEAQNPASLAALDLAAVSGPTTIRYSPNESGGAIRLVAAPGDSLAVERVRVHLLETAAAIRRGDYRRITILDPDLPAIAILSARRSAVRCTYRPTPGGAELLLLSDDEAVVAAIHQALAGEPPRIPPL